MTIKYFIEKLIYGESLTREEAENAFLIIVKGGATPAQIAAILIALKIKGETKDEIAGAVAVLRLRSEKFTAPENALDSCGTGGDGSRTYNISTAVGFVVAGAGIPVAKHGNKAISSHSGSADVLRELGVNVDAERNIMEQSLREANICFMMASKYHRSIRHISPIRQELGVRTIFNILGPLVNPAGAKYQLLGVYDKNLVEKIAEVLAEFGTKRAWVVHGNDGMDEITTTNITTIAELKNGQISTFTLNPSEYGIEIVKAEKLRGGDAKYNAQAMRLLLLGGGNKAYRDIVLLNSAAALLVCGKVKNLNDGLLMAKDSLDSGNANAALLKLIEISNLNSR